MDFVYQSISSRICYFDASTTKKFKYMYKKFCMGTYFTT